MNKKQCVLSAEDEPFDINEWAITVNELEMGKFYFSLLKAIHRSDDLLGYQPELTGEKAYERPMDAWVAGIVALRKYATAKAQSSLQSAHATTSGYSIA